ncbi:MAG: zinc-ribbon domain-containing protein [Actinomycetota bacterium]
MIIFGWGGGKAKHHGPAVAQACRTCGHEGFLHYFTVTKWFRLYFIPIVPYNTKHFLACPVCTAGTELTTPAERQRVRALVGTTMSLASGLAPDAHVEQVRSAFGEPSPAPPLPTRPKRQPTMPAPPPMAKRIRAGESWSE